MKIIKFSRWSRFSALATLFCLLLGWTGTGNASGTVNTTIDGTDLLRGVVLPVNQSKLGFTQSGLVIERPLEGTVVSKGTILARIDDRDTRLKMAKAKAGLASAKLALKQAVREQEKTKLLIEKGIMSDTAIVDGEDAIELAKIGIQQAQVEVDTARSALRGCVLKAPFDGAVVSVTANLGEWIGAGAEVLVLVDLSRLEVSMDVAPESIGDIRVGTKSDIFAENHLVGRGEVRTILPLVDAASGLRRVIWRVNSEQGAVVAGRYVTLRLK